MIVADVAEGPVCYVEPETTLADAARIMLAQRVSGLPVLENGGLCGVVTEGDLLRRAEIGTDRARHGWFKTFFMPASLAKTYVHTHGRFVRDVMTADPVTVTRDTPLATAAELMCTHHIKRLPVMEGAKLVGVISRTDLLRVLARKLIELTAPLSEAQIKQHIMQTLAQERWAPKTGIEVKVTGSVVDLEGTIFSVDEQSAVRVIAETTPGVTEVHDHLVFIDPTSGMSFPLD
jgi:CBS domain-containing protein